MLHKKMTLIAVGFLLSLSTNVFADGQITFKGRIVDDRCLQLSVNELESSQAMKSGCFGNIEKISLQTQFSGESTAQKSTDKEVLVLTYN